VAECQRCERTDLNLTQNGRVKSHAANGKRAHPETNPHCPGGSDWPKEHVRAMARQGDDASAAKLMAWGEDPSGDGSVDNRPTAEDVASALAAMRSPDCPEEVFSAAEEVLYIEATFGKRGEQHVHRFEPSVADGVSVSFCACGAEEPYDPATAAALGVSVQTLPKTGPNPHRAPLPTGKPEALAQGWTAEEWEKHRGPAGVWSGALAEEDRTSDVATAGDGSWQETTRPPSSAGTKTGGPISGRSSRPGTAASAPNATGGSMTGTGSGRPEKGTTSMPSAQTTGSAVPDKPVNEATAFLSGMPDTSGGAPATGRISSDVPRDRWGRYLLPHPRTGVQQPWTRTTTLASSIADTYALSMWSQRMAVKGLTLRQDLFALAAGYDVSLDKDEMNSVCEQAKSAAGDKVAANLGTAMHNFTAAVDRGQQANIPPFMQSDVDAYSAALRASGFELVPELIERRVALVKATAGEDVAGTFDRIYRATRDVSLKLSNNKTVLLPAGTHVIGDLKTGRDLAYAWGEIAIQETVYAHGFNENGIWDPDAKVWIPEPLGGAKVSEQVGIVIHLPIQKTPGQPACMLYAIDLEQGWDAISLCVAVRNWRKQKRIATVLEVVDQAPRPAAVPAPVTVSDDTIRQADAQFAQNEADREAREARYQREHASLTAQGPGSAQEPVADGRRLREDSPQEAAPGYDKPTAAQLADYPSVARQTPAQPALAIDTPPAPREPSWEDRAKTVTTKAEASAVYEDMRAHIQQVGMTRFNAVVKAMQLRLKSLTEPGG
jgi:hypothetical protein